MRKLTIFLSLAALLAATNGCCCCGRIRNWFHKGSPCGTTTVAPAVLGAPLAMGTPMQQPIMAAPMAAPMMAAPMMAAPGVCCEQAPVCVQACDPCDPCGGMATGFAPAVEGCGCGGGATMTVAPTVQVPQGTVTVPGPVGE
jgi:hypothetical protein